MFLPLLSPEAVTHLKFLFSLMCSDAIIEKASSKNSQLL